MSILLLLSFAAQGQDTTYYDYDHNKVKSIEFARSYDVTVYDLPDSTRKVIRKYDRHGIIESEIHYVRVISEQGFKNYVCDGKYKDWYTNGQLQRDVDYVTNKIDGELLTYWSNGKLRRKEQYRENISVSGTCYANDGTATKFIPYIILPAFVGGESGLMKYLITNLKYPADLEKTGIEGKVLIGFVVNKAGTITKINVVRKDHEAFNQEAIRVVSKMPKWKPGMVEGELASVHFVLPITFRLE
jgi:periplasmic protein TonB